MNTTPLPGAADLAVSVEDLVAGRWSRLRSQLDPTMRDSLSEDSLAVAWAQVVGRSGAVESHGSPAVSRADDVTVTETPISLEAGDYIARIAYRTIAGLFVLPEGTP